MSELPEPYEINWSIQEGRLPLRVTSGGHEILPGVMVGVSAAWLDRLQTQLAECDAEVEVLEEALESMLRWSRAYPEDIFIEPDWTRARELLEGGGMTLDAVSGGAIRRAMKGVGELAEAALAAYAAPGEERVCADCGKVDDTLVHYPTGLAGQGPLLSLCLSCRSSRKNNNYAAPGETGEV